MAQQNPELNLNYSELLITTELVIISSLRLQQSGAPEAQCQSDMALLCQLANIPGDSEEQADDGL